MTVLIWMFWYVPWKKNCFQHYILTKLDHCAKLRCRQCSAPAAVRVSVRQPSSLELAESRHQVNRWLPPVCRYMRREAVVYCFFLWNSWTFKKILPFQSKKKWFFVVNIFVLIVPIEWQDKTWRADSDFEGKNYLCWLDLTVKLVKHEKCHIHGFKNFMKSICVSLEELMKEIQVMSITEKFGNILLKQNIFKFVWKLQDSQNVWF